MKQPTTTVYFPGAKELVGKIRFFKYEPFFAARDTEKDISLSEGIRLILLQKINGPIPKLFAMAQAIPLESFLFGNRLSNWVIPFGEHNNMEYD